ncbi:MAG: ABC transporter ATP-binding protein [Synergistaceae bacterium]|jgi:branched-chain amino acid transport system ATP-binding protein|nr:ABC transporter ATP-binding protein [Synergistaceae bacterium]
MPITPENPSVLEVRDLGIRFGGLQAVDSFHYRLKEGDLGGIIGPNGAGKTTIFNMLTGIYPPTSGEIFFRGENIVGKSIHDFTACGIARTFQNIRLFRELSALENIKIASHMRVRYGLFPALFRAPSVRRREDELEYECMALLDRLSLTQYAHSRASSLPYGIQRRLEIARALATSPRLLLLDEPAAGMNPQEVDRLAKTILWIRDEFKVTILLIEHHMQLVMNVCDHISVVNFGKLIAEGTPGEIRTNPAVIEAYLGKGGKF